MSTEIDKDVAYMHACISTRKADRCKCTENDNVTGTLTPECLTLEFVDVTTKQIL